ncbi:retrovirus-related pol polyprotein from transposon TNT 1-94, partial [Tanacetum coccineum]
SRRCGVGTKDLIISSLALDMTDYTQTLVHIPRGPNNDRINKLKARLAREFEMKDLGPTNKTLGMQIHRDRVSRKNWLSQKSYVKKILQRFSMQDYKPISTPFPTDVKLSSKMSPSSEKERMEMSRVPYASVVGSLMFVIICTRPDIAHAVGVVSWYMAEPGREHWEAVKRILRYVKGTSDVALCFGDSYLIVTGYVDSDYAGDLDGSKSTTGYVFTLFGGTVSWVSKLQSVVAMSTTEAEYVVAAQASKEAVWLKMLLEELGHKQEKITLFCDNQSALYLARNQAFIQRQIIYEFNITSLMRSIGISIWYLHRVGLVLVLVSVLNGSSVTFGSASLWFRLVLPRSALGIVWLVFFDALSAALSAAICLICSSSTSIRTSLLLNLYLSAALRLPLFGPLCLNLNLSEFVICLNLLLSESASVCLNLMSEFASVCLNLLLVYLCSDLLVIVGFRVFLSNSQCSIVSLRGNASLIKA